MLAQLMSLPAPAALMLMDMLQDSPIIRWLLPAVFTQCVCAAPVVKRNDTDDARAKVLDSEELIHYLQQRAQIAVDSRDDAEEHLRHVSNSALPPMTQMQALAASS